MTAFETRLRNWSARFSCQAQHDCRHRAIGVDSQLSGSRIKLLRYSMPIPAQLIHKMEICSEVVLAAQRRLLKHMIHKEGARSVANLLQIPPPCVDAPFVSEDLLDAVRLDLLVDLNGTAKLCKINAESSIGGGGMGEIHKAWLSAQSRDLVDGKIKPHPSPADCLALMLREKPT
jgi:hypothetical protein